MKVLKFFLFAFISICIGFIVFNYIFLPGFIQKGKEIPVPDIIGKSYTNAETILKTLGLKMKVKSERIDKTIPEGYIISQKPESGYNVKKGRIIFVILSKGFIHQKMPDVRGMNLKQGKTFLYDNDCKVGKIIYIYSGDSEKEKIVGTSSESGSNIFQGAIVDLLVNRSPKPGEYLMPDFTGREFEIVSKLLDKKGFEIGQVEYIPDLHKLKGTIVGQTPKAGSLLIKGDRIDFKITSEG